MKFFISRVSLIVFLAWSTVAIWNYSQEHIEYSSFVHDKYEDQTRSGRYFYLLLTTPKGNRYVSVDHLTYKSYSIKSFIKTSQRRLELYPYWSFIGAIYGSISFVGSIVLIYTMASKFSSLYRPSS